MLTSQISKFTAPATKTPASAPPQREPRDLIERMRTNRAREHAAEVDRLATDLRKARRAALAALRLAVVGFIVDGETHDVVGLADTIGMDALDEVRATLRRAHRLFDLLEVREALMEFATDDEDPFDVREQDVDSLVYEAACERKALGHTDQPPERLALEYFLARLGELEAALERERVEAPSGMLS